MTAEEKIKLLIEYLKEDIQTSRSCEKLMKDRGSYDMANQFKYQRMTDEVILSMLENDDFAKDMLKAVKGELK